jgi:membrane protease YdiL (CAAX protease family)
LLITALSIVITRSLGFLAYGSSSIALNVACLSWQVLAVLLIIFSYRAMRRKHAAWQLPPVLPSSGRGMHFAVAPLTLTVGIACSALVANTLDIDILAQYHARPDTVVAVVAVMLLPTIALVLSEEMLMRGYLLSWVTHHLGTVGGIVGSSAIFGLYHFYPDYWSMILTLVGILLAIMVRMTGSLFHATVFHVGYNLMVAFIEGPNMANH